MRRHEPEWRRALRENRLGYERLRLRYRVLRDISERSLATTILGSEISMPVIIAPEDYADWLGSGGDETPQALVADQEVRRLYLGESFAL